MADNPITTPLPADLPTDWVYGQTIGPQGTDVGLSPQHGYNYLMQQVNAAQQAATQIGQAFIGLPSLGSGGKIPPEQLPEMDFDEAGSAAAVQKNLDAHTGNKNNPHGVTAAQVGADPAGSAAAVQKNLDAHTGNKNNPHAVTAAQVGAATPDEVFAMLYNAGNIEKVFESSAAGATTFDLPADTLMWWGLAVGGGGGGSSGEDDYYGGGGGAGGQVKVSGPYTPEAVKSNGIVIGAGGAGGAQAGTGQNSGSPGGTTSVFSLIAADGGPGGSKYTGGSGTGTSSGGNGKDRSPSVGSNGQSMPFGAATTFAAGGGGGGANITSSDPRRTGSLGGSADIGAGGKGGDGAPQSGVGGTGVNGSPGGGGGGGGGGGKSAGGAGGKGGDGYAAIFIIRKGGRA